MSTDAEAVAALCARAPDVVVTVVGTERIIAADIDGDPVGTPVILVHGTPDSRLARHPDPSIAASLGVRLIAVDRPGFGHSTPDPKTTPMGFATDLVALLDHCDIETAHLLAWSAGTIWAIGAAAAISDRVRSVTAVGALAPSEAFDDPLVRDTAGGARLGMIDTAAELGADEAADLIAPMLVANPMTAVAALEHRAESGASDLDAVPGATVQMAAACCDAVRAGPAGLIRDVAIQLGDHGLDLATITVPVHLITGAHDSVCPAAFAQWYAARIPRADVRIVPGAGHGLLLTHWQEILTQVVRR